MSIDFQTFNLIEGVFWVACAVLSVVGSHHFHQPGKWFWRILAFDFLLFGVSDVVEALDNESFLLPGGTWLLIWKLVCIVMFVVLIGYYIRVRAR